MHAQPQTCTHTHIHKSYCGLHKWMSTHITCTLYTGKQAHRHTGWLISPVPWGGYRIMHLGRAGFLIDCFPRVLSLEGVGHLLLNTQWWALQDCYPRHPLYLAPPSLALALAPAPSHVTEPMPEPGQLQSGTPTPHSSGHRTCRRAGGGVFVILFPGLSQFSGQVCLYPMSGESIHPATCLWIWGAGELRSQVRWWLAQGLVWFKASLGCISLCDS